MLRAYCAGHFHSTSITNPYVVYLTYVLHQFYLNNTGKNSKRRPHPHPLRCGLLQGWSLREGGRRQWSPYLNVYTLLRLNVSGITGSWCLHGMLITSVAPVATTKLTVLSFPLALANENDFSQKGSYVSFWHQQQFKVTMTFPGWTPCCVSQWPPGQVLRLLLRSWPPCFSMQSCKKRWCLHLLTAVRAELALESPHLSSTPVHHGPSSPAVMGNLSTGSRHRLLAQVHPETSQHSAV